MGANYSFEVKNIEIWVPAFFIHNNSFIATVCLETMLIILISIYLSLIFMGMKNKSNWFGDFLNSDLFLTKVARIRLYENWVD